MSAQTETPTRKDSLNARWKSCGWRVSGLRNKEIAERLHLSQRTVEGHLSHVFTKLNLGSRTEAVLHAAARGWLVIPSTT